MRIVLACLLGVAAAAGGAPTWADDDSGPMEVRLPHVGLSVDVPAGWAIHQYGPTVLKLTRGKAMLSVRVAAEGAAEPADRLQNQARRARSRAAGGEAPEPETWDVPGSSAAALLSYETAKDAVTLGAIARSDGTMPRFQCE